MWCRARGGIEWCDVPAVFSHESLFLVTQSVSGIRKHTKVESGMDPVQLLLLKAS
jgi:hypothetical protein